MTYPPSYHGNQPAPPARAPGTKGFLIGGITVAVLAAIGSVLVLMFGFESETTEPEADSAMTPTEVTQTYMTAIVDADLVAAYELRCDADVQEVHEKWGGTTPSDQAIEDAQENAENLSFSIIEGSENISGETATVQADVNSEFGSSVVTANLVREEDEWRVCGEFT